MTSHEYAERLQQIATYLLEHESFEAPAYDEVIPLRMQFFSDKDLFISGVRALKNGKKSVTPHEDLVFTSGPVELVVNRDKVCRKIQEEKWECQPLLSEDEEALVIGE